MSDYKANAEKLIDDIDSLLDEAGRDHFAERVGALALIEATRAQALATLALVEQQRIANLIALCDATWANGSAAFPRLNDAARDAVTREGLGL